MQPPKRIEPGPGQESVWDYPRPPRLEKCLDPIRVVFAGREIASSTQALRVLETSHPPTIYIPPSDADQSVLIPNRRRGLCEWKGQAHYLDVEVDERRAVQAAWTYPAPVPAFESLRDHIAFYPILMEACYVGDEQVESQEGDFYGGWITSKIVGPFKGGQGTWGW